MGKPDLSGLGARAAPPNMKQGLGQMLGELVRIWFSSSGFVGRCGVSRQKNRLCVRNQAVANRIADQIRGRF